MRLLALLVVPLSIASMVSAAPPPPPPPPAAEDAAVKAAIDRAATCVGGGGGQSERGAAMKAVEHLSAPPGSEAWRQAQASVAAFIARREAERRCINELETLRSTGLMSSHDREVVTAIERGLISFWLQQGDYAVGIVAKLAGIPTDAGNYPLSLHY